MRSVAPDDASLCEDVAQAVNVQPEFAGLQPLARALFFREPLIDSGDDGCG